MATSAFKSNTRRGSARSGGSENSPNKAPIRRSHSVSSLSRARDHHQQFDISSDFLNKRDNPLFCSDVSPPDKQIQTQSPVGLAQFAQNPTKASGSALPSNTGSAYAQRERGRALTRNELAGRSLSGMDRGRRGRSVSRGHYAASEGELERFSVVSPNYRNKSSLNVSANSLKKANTQRKSNELRVIEPSDNSASYLEAPYLGGGISMGSLSEAEEKTISAVCEQMKSSQGDHVGGVGNAANGIYETVRSEVRRAISDIQNDLESAIRRNNDGAIAGTNVADIPPDLVNPGAVELVLDIRREYARKLEESQERATKLRADLAIEEQRGQELSRILKEIIPDPKTNNVQKSRPGRKNSSERRKMSKRLTEEAMAYFDECVSISTFDSSDFSAPEDLPFSLNGATTLEHAHTCLDHGSPSVSTSCCRNSCLSHKQESSSHGLPMGSHMDSSLTASSASNEPMINQSSVRGTTAEWSRKSQFSLSQKPSENVGLEQLIRNYIENAVEESEQNRNNPENIRLNYHGVDEYLQGCTESLLFDRVLLKNRIDTGSLHLCVGSIAISCSPFGGSVV